MDVSKSNAERVPRRVLGALLSGMSAGVVPRSGAPYIAIGRIDEIRALTDDLARVADGGSAMRFLVGRYGSGKSFLIQLLRSRALESGFLTADADLSPERRLSGEGGAATYRELSRNLAAKASPDGGAWSTVLSRFAAAHTERVDNALTGDAYRHAYLSAVRETLAPLTEEVGGYDFAAVLLRYCEGFLAGDEDVTASALRWLRGEFRTKTEARAALSLRTVSVVDDANWYTHLRLLAAFSRIAGYRGLLVLIDECVNLYKIPNRISRESNYEKILSMYNDTLQGVAPALMLVLGGTPRFLEDSRRGLYSYEALHSRLSDARFQSTGDTALRNMMSPVIRLRRLSDSELLALCLRLRTLHAQYYATPEAVSDGFCADFLRESLSRAGAEEMVTPREIIRDFVTLLDLLYQNPGVAPASLLKNAPRTDTPTDPDGESALSDFSPEIPVAPVAPDAPAAPPTPPVRVTLDTLEL